METRLLFEPYGLAPFHGFVQWRIVEGKFAERWATVTSLAELPEGMNVW
jgi:hypothetical protein